MPISIDDVYSEWMNEVQEILHEPAYNTDRRVEELDELVAVLHSQQVRFKALIKVYSAMEYTTKKLADTIGQAHNNGVVL